jgi:hypothetical protein
VPNEPLDDDRADADSEPVARGRTVLDIAVPLLIALAVAAALTRPWTWW